MSLFAAPRRGLRESRNWANIASMKSGLPLSASVAVLVACGGGEQPPKCVPGASVECACPNGQRGAQTCTVAGAFSACVCASDKPYDAGPGEGGGTGGGGGATAPSTSLGSGGQASGGSGGLGGASANICTGTPATCAVHSTNSECAVVGCKWSSDQCLGTPLSCSGAATSTACSAIVGCSWSSLSSTCLGSPVSCSTRLERSACASQGCSWVPAGCAGTGLACSSFTTDYSCTFAGCTWQPGNPPAPSGGGMTSTGGRTGTGGTSNSASTGGVTVSGGIGGRGGTTGAGGMVVTGGASGTGGTGGTVSTGVPNLCGDGKVDPGELCDCGSDSKVLPAGCPSINGTFYGDGKGCTRTCTTEPSCLDANGKTQACTTTCGDGNVDDDEACDDGNRLGGDGCSSTCKVEEGFTCSTKTAPDTVPCSQGGSSDCLQLPAIFRDFQPENVTGGHPDFYFLGTKANGSATPTTLCVPDASGPARGNDSTARCWDIAAPELVNGRPQHNSARADNTCACQFSDWSMGNTSHIPSGYAKEDSPLSAGFIASGTALTVTGPSGTSTGTITGYTMSSPGGPIWKGTVPIVKDATSFGQWFADDATVNKTFKGLLELSAVAWGTYRFASKLHLLGSDAGFFPLDSLNPGQARSCNLWPYWNRSSGSPIWSSCMGDQYLFPPMVVQSDCPNQNPLSNGCWVSQTQGAQHDAYFTTELRHHFVYDRVGGLSLKFYGDDDLFVFINGKLVLDLGGPHYNLAGSISVAGDPAVATIVEGGCLDAAGNITGATAGSTACSPTNSHPPAASSPSDFRNRTVDLSLVNGKLYELAIFAANRHPTPYNFNLTISGPTKRSSTCARK